MVQVLSMQPLSSEPSAGVYISSSSRKNIPVPCHALEVDAMQPVQLRAMQSGKDHGPCASQPVSVHAES